MHKFIRYRFMVPASAISLALALAATPVMADPPQRDNVWQGNPRDQAPQETPRQKGPAKGSRKPARGGRQSQGGDQGTRTRQATPQRRAQPPRGRTDARRDQRRWNDPIRKYRHPTIYEGRVYAPPGRTRFYRHIMIVRPYGHWYHGYGFYRNDDNALKWLALTAITMVIINELSEQQERTYENAQVQATTAPVGQTIHWNDGNASGTVTATRDGTSSDGRYCREFQQTVTIGGKSEQAYGIACQQPDGAWQVISSGQ